MQPFAKTPLALLLVQHYSIAECELRIIRPCPIQQKQSYIEIGSYTIVNFINIKSYTPLPSITTIIYKLLSKIFWLRNYLQGHA